MSTIRVIGHPVRLARETTGERLQRLRLACDLTQMALAAEAGVSQQTVSGLETGTSEPSAATLAELADALGVSMDFLYRGREDVDVRTQ